MAQGRYNVLFLSNRNTARSIFAEAVTNRIAARISKASVPGCIRPESSIRSLRMSCAWRAMPPKVCIQNPGRISREPTHLRSISFSPCAIRMTGEPVPHWPGRPVTADWRYEDPVRLKCEDWERCKELGAMLADRERRSGL